MNNLKFIGIIPARYASTRFPGKPLAQLGGKCVIERVWQQATSVLSRVAVATDDQRIADVVRGFGGVAVMTRADHPSGTDRCREAYEVLGGGEDVVVNIQGDEPFIQPEQIEALMACFDAPDTQIATLVRPFTDKDSAEDLENPNTPKVEWDKVTGEAKMFSRSVIACADGSHYRHIGIYAYRADVLAQITKLAQSPLELAERLEQLRWLENGYHIRVGVTEQPTIGIDTPDDLARAIEWYKYNG
jgi:3-deoxy-manno-octulosonate cytidylyltransferase (CMP-KDO synthetase)